MPVSHVAEFVTRASAAVCGRLPGIRPIAFGHVGDGNIHFNLTQPEDMDKAAYLARWQEFNDLVHGVVRDLHGSISAEHGVGIMKRGEITHYKPAIEIELMRHQTRARPARHHEPRQARQGLRGGKGAIARALIEAFVFEGFRRPLAFAQNLIASRFAAPEADAVFGSTALGFGALALFCGIC